MTSKTVYPRELVAEHLAVSPGLLIRYEARGLVQPVRDDSGLEGYGPAEIRRLWTVVSLHRDLGVNLAGVEAILRLRAHVDRLQSCLLQILDEFDESLPPPETTPLERQELDEP